MNEQSDRADKVPDAWIAPSSLESVRKGYSMMVYAQRGLHETIPLFRVDPGAVLVPRELQEPLELTNEQVLQLAPMAGNFSDDEVVAFCAGVRRGINLVVNLPATCLEKTKGPEGPLESTT